MSATSSLGRRIVRNTLHAAGGRLAALLVWFAYTPLLLASLGPERFGLWSLFFAIVTTLLAFDLGLSQATLRHVADAHARDDDAAAGGFASLAAIVFVALGAGWMLFAWLGGAVVLGAMRIPPALGPEATIVLIAGAAVFAIMGVSQVAMAVEQGYGRFDLANLSMLAMTAQTAIGVPFVLWRGWGLRGLIVNVALGWLVALIVALIAIRRALPRFRWGRPRAGREAVGFGVALQISAASLAAHQHLDKFLLVPAAGIGIVAHVELGYRVSNAATSLLQMLLLAVLPAATALSAAREPERLLRLYRRGTRYVLTATVLLFSALAAGADRLFAAWVGPGHEASALVLRGLALAAAIFMITGMGTSIARGVGRADLEAQLGLLVLGLHLAIAIPLIPRLGLMGALIAMIASTLVGALVFLWRLATTLGWSRWRKLVVPHVVPLAAAAAGLLAGGAMDRAWQGGPRLGLALVGLAAAATGALVTLATGYLRWRDVRALLAIGGQEPRPAE